LNKVAFKTNFLQDAPLLTIFLPPINICYFSNGIASVSERIEAVSCRSKHLDLFAEKLKLIIYILNNFMI